MRAVQPPQPAGYANAGEFATAVAQATVASLRGYVRQVGRSAGSTAKQKVEGNVRVVQLGRIDGGTVAQTPNRAIAVVGASAPIAVGFAFSFARHGSERVACTFFGEGAANKGDMHEAMNLAAIWSLPVIFLCENNLYAMGTPVLQELAQPDIHLRAASYGIPAEFVDGMDVLAVEPAVRLAADAVRGGEGPRFLELRTYRFRAHSMFDPQLYREKQEVEEWKKRDPILTFGARLKEQELLDDDGLKRIEDEVAAEVEKAVEFAEAGTWEPVEELTRFVYSETRP